MAKVKQPVTSADACGGHAVLDIQCLDLSRAAASLRTGRGPSDLLFPSPTTSSGPATSNSWFPSWSWRPESARTWTTAYGQPASRRRGRHPGKAGMPIAEPDAALLEQFLVPMHATIPREV